MVNIEKSNEDTSLIWERKRSKPVAGRRAESIYKKPAELRKALDKAGLDIQKQEAAKNLGPVLGERLKRLSKEIAGGNEVARSAHKSKLADLKLKRAEKDQERAEILKQEIASYKEQEKQKRAAAGKSKERGEIGVTDAYLIEMQEAPSQTKTSEKTPVVSGEISSEFELPKQLKSEAEIGAVKQKREYNKNVISRDLYKAAKNLDEETTISKAENERQRAKELRAEESQKAYVKAYREYNPKFAKDKSDDMIAITRPPFFSLFSPVKKELKRLHEAMVKARENAASEAEDEKIQENVAAAGRIKFKDTEPGLKPEAKEILKWGAEAEERAAEIKRGRADVEVDEMLNKLK